MTSTVYDKYTKVPIADVKCTVLQTGQTYYSDSVGNFSIRGEFESLVPKPKSDIAVEFSKEGYHTLTIAKPQVVYLVNKQALHAFNREVEHCGQDNSPKLNRYEATFLNNYIDYRNHFDFNDKRVLFVTGSSGEQISSKKAYFDNVKRWKEKYGDKIQTSSRHLSAEETERYGYDAIVYYWVKITKEKSREKVLEQAKTQAANTQNILH